VFHVHPVSEETDLKIVGFSWVKLALLLRACWLTVLTYPAVSSAGFCTLVTSVTSVLF
jgi:hypothetical protein